MFFRSLAPRFAFTFKLLIYSLFVSFSLAGCSPTQTEKSIETFYTWEGFGPDKWASAWMINRHLSENAKIEVLPAGTVLENNSNTFDFPTAQVKRVDNRTTFELLSKEQVTSDPELKRLVEIIHDIEVNFWGDTQDPYSDIVESGFRALQRNQDAKAVPNSCYFEFFDRVYASLRADTLAGSGQDLLPDESCYRDVQIATASAQASFIPELDVNHVVDEMKKGEKVAFIDVREPWEFAENHIPNAINVQLRDAAKLSAQEYKSYKYVVAYCVKDFRGFEMAKTLKLNGFENVVILNPYGIKGWKAAGKPIMSENGLSDAQAYNALLSCSSTEQNCSVSLGGGQ